MLPVYCLLLWFLAFIIFTVLLRISLIDILLYCQNVSCVCGWHAGYFDEGSHAYVCTHWVHHLHRETGVQLLCGCQHHHLHGLLFLQGKRTQWGKVKMYRELDPRRDVPACSMTSSRFENDNSLIGWSYCLIMTDFCGTQTEKKNVFPLNVILFWVPQKNKGWMSLEIYEHV